MVNFKNKNFELLLLSIIILILIFNILSLNQVDVDNYKISRIDIVAGSDVEKYFNAGLLISNKFLGITDTPNMPSIENMYYSNNGLLNILTGRAFTFPMFLSITFLPLLSLGLGYEIYLVLFTNIILIILSFISVKNFQKTFNTKNLTLPLAIFFLLPSVQLALTNLFIELFSSLLFINVAIYTKKIFYLDQKENKNIILFTIFLVSAALNHKLSLYICLLFLLSLIVMGLIRSKFVILPTAIFSTIIGFALILSISNSPSLFGNEKGWGLGGYYTAYTGLYLPIDIYEGYCCKPLHNSTQHPTYYLNHVLINGSCKDLQLSILEKNNKHFSNAVLLNEINQKQNLDQSPCFSNLEIAKIFTSEITSLNGINVYFKKFIFTNFIGCNYYLTETKNVILNNLSNCGELEYFSNLNFLKVLLNFFEISTRLYVLIAFLKYLKSKKFKAVCINPFVFGYLVFIPLITTAEPRYFFHVFLPLIIIAGMKNEKTK